MSNNLLILACIKMIGNWCKRVGIVKKSNGGIFRIISFEGVFRMKSVKSCPVFRWQQILGLFSTKLKQQQRKPVLTTASIGSGRIVDHWPRQLLVKIFRLDRLRQSQIKIFDTKFESGQKIKKMGWSILIKFYFYDMFPKVLIGHVSMLIAKLYSFH